MALRYVTDPDDGDHVTATVRLCLTEGRDRLVPDTDPEARWLFCAPGARIKRADAQRYGLLEAPKPPAEPEAGEQEAPKAQRATSKAGRRPANKSRRPAANKSAKPADSADSGGDDGGDGGS